MIYRAHRRPPWDKIIVAGFDAIKRIVPVVVWGLLYAYIATIIMVYVVTISQTLSPKYDVYMKAMANCSDWCETLCE
jgi:hypothetical protein